MSDPYEKSNPIVFAIAFIVLGSCTVAFLFLIASLIVGIFVPITSSGHLIIAGFGIVSAIGITTWRVASKTGK